MAGRRAAIAIYNVAIVTRQSKAKSISAYLITGITIRTPSEVGSIAFALSIDKLQAKNSLIAGFAGKIGIACCAKGRSAFCAYKYRIN